MTKSAWYNNPSKELTEDDRQKHAEFLHWRFGMGRSGPLCIGPGNITRVPDWAGSDRSQID